MILFAKREILTANRYMQHFNNYEAQLEAKIEALVNACECTPDQFFEALKMNRDGETPVYVEVILAATDYDNFLKMMSDYKKKVAGQ